MKGEDERPAVVMTQESVTAALSDLDEAGSQEDAQQAGGLDRREIRQRYTATLTFTAMGLGWTGGRRPDRMISVR